MDCIKIINHGTTTDSISVSVVVAIYNVEDYLEQCLRSLAAQSPCVSEIICIDDGSTDRSSVILDRCAQHDSRIKVLHRENGGYGSAMNLGMSMASGDYIGIVEPDDFVDPALYSVLAEAAARHDAPDIVKASYWRIVNAGSSSEEQLPAFYLGEIAHVDAPFTIEEDADLLLYHPSIWTAMYRREFLEANNINFKECPGAGWVDNPFLMETMCAARSIVYIDEPLYYYREFSDALSGGLKDPRIISDRWIEMDEAIKRYGITSHAVLEAHMSRGCSYLEMLQKDFDRHDAAVRTCASAMLNRMDKSVIRHSKKILPSYKRAYIRALKQIDRLRYLFQP